MAFQKNKITKFGIVANYWTLIYAEIKSFPINDAVSKVTYGLFLNHDSYNAGAEPLETVSWYLPFQDAIPMAYPILSPFEIYIKSLPGVQDGFDLNGDPIITPNFFADAETAPE